MSCNQFGNQAPGTEKEIGEFCQLKYHVTFKLFQKIEVNGAVVERFGPMVTPDKIEKKIHEVIE